MPTTRTIEATAFEPGGTRLIRSAPPGGGRPVNEGRGRRVDLATIEGDGRAILARYDLAGSDWPVAIAVWERHPFSDQAFLALDGEDALAVVAPAGPDGRPALAAAEAFRMRPGTPFLYPAGLWHAPLFALERPGRFLMAMRETGRGDDTEEWRSDTPLTVVPDRSNDGTG